MANDELEAVKARVQAFVADGYAAGEHRILVYREDARALLAALDAVAVECASERGRAERAEAALADAKREIVERVAFEVLTASTLGVARERMERLAQDYAPPKPERSVKPVVALAELDAEREATDA